jgi:hypothetical protein
MLVMGLPSAPAAVPALVCRSVQGEWGRQQGGGNRRETKGFELTALADSSVQHLGKHFIVRRGRNGIIVFELDAAAQFVDTRDGLGRGDCGRHG